MLTAMIASSTSTPRQPSPRSSPRPIAPRREEGRDEARVRVIGILGTRRGPTSDAVRGRPSVHSSSGCADRVAGYKRRALDVASRVDSWNRALPALTPYDRTDTLRRDPRERRSLAAVPAHRARSTGLGREDGELGSTQRNPHEPGREPGREPARRTRG